MSVHAPADTQPGRAAGAAQEQLDGRKRPPSLSLRIAGAAVIWALVVAGLAGIWHWGFDFPTWDAWVLAIGLMSMVALLILLMVIVMSAMWHEEETVLRRQSPGRTHDVAS